MTDNPNSNFVSTNHEDASFKFAILTISDAGSKGERDDTSGDTIREMMSGAGFTEVGRDIVPDEKELISHKLEGWCDGGDVDLVLTTGGTGLGPRDVTPEATRAVIDLEVPGIGEAVRIQTLKYTPMAMLSRAVAGVRSGVPDRQLARKPDGSPGVPGGGHAGFSTRPGDDQGTERPPGPLGIQHQIRYQHRRDP